MKRSSLIIPISVVVHLSIINLSLYGLMSGVLNHPMALLCINVSWLLVALALDFYPTERNEKFFTNLEKFIQQCLIFSLSYFTILAFSAIPFSPAGQLLVISIICFNLSVYRWLFYIIRSVYRIEGGNTVSVVVIGRDGNLKKIRKVFDQPELGYRYKGFFDNKFSLSSTYLGPVEDAIDYILENRIDEMYCLASQLSNVQLKALVRFADNNLKKIKIVPDNKEIFSRAMEVQLFDTIPVLNLRKSPLETEYAKMGKRLFDIVFSSLIILLVLSWLTPLLFILIKLESKGPLLFNQLRHGYNKKPFRCYKFRSMAVNKDSNSKMATKNDMRITKIGRFIRKTSIDELPQFFNVFLGDMSVVGPRPHMEAHTQQYEVSVDKYLVRHFAKPGITGLAQVKGFRGEIVKPADIFNRTRMDVFYLEKWSPQLDMKIIYATVANVIKGEERAY